MNPKCGTCTVAQCTPNGNDRLVPNLSPDRQDPLLVALGEAIRVTRKSREISQEKLALLADVDRSHMGRIERGDNNVAVLTLAQIAAALGVSLSELFLIAGY